MNNTNRQDGGNYRSDNKYYLPQNAGDRLAQGSSWPTTLGRSDFSLWRKKGEVKWHEGEVGPVGGVRMYLEILLKFKIFFNSVIFIAKQNHCSKKSLNSASYDLLSRYITVYIGRL